MKISTKPKTQLKMTYYWLTLKEVQRPNEIWINAKTSPTIKFHLKHDEKREDLPLDQQVPKEFHEYLNVFDENKAD